MTHAPRIALLAAAVLAAPAPAAPAFDHPPGGDYEGRATTGRYVTFHLSFYYNYVVGFHGGDAPVRFERTPFYFSTRSPGWFNRWEDRTHVWGHWSTEQRGHVHGGYGFDDAEGQRHVVHWYAVAERIRR